eukprot:5828297-Amphidinium_carterae.1
MAGGAGVPRWQRGLSTTSKLCNLCACQRCNIDNPALTDALILGRSSRFRLRGSLSNAVIIGMGIRREMCLNLRIVARLLIQCRSSHLSQRRVGGLGLCWYTT